MKIEFLAVYGDTYKKVILAQPVGAGDIWYLSIDDCHYGQIVPANGELKAYFNSLDITGDDISILLDMIKEKCE